MKRTNSQRTDSKRFSMSRRPSINLVSAGNLNLENLRKSERWSESPASLLRPCALQERLQELLVLELRKDGGRDYMRVSVRALYKHVLAAICSSRSAGRRQSRRQAKRVSNLATAEPMNLREAMLMAQRLTQDDEHASPRLPVRKGSLASAATAQDYQSMRSSWNNGKGDGHVEPNNDGDEDIKSSLVTWNLDTIFSGDATDETNGDDTVPIIEDSGDMCPDGAGVAFVSQGRETEEHTTTDYEYGDQVNNHASNETADERHLRNDYPRTRLPPMPVPPPHLTRYASSKDVTAGRSVTYREKLGAYLHPRDMRRLVTPFSTTNEPDLIVRRHAILLNFDPLRAIILRDRLLVLVPDGADSLLVSLERRVHGGSDDFERTVAAAMDSSDRPVVKVDSSNSNHPERGADEKQKKNVMKKVLEKGAKVLQTSADVGTDVLLSGVNALRTSAQTSANVIKTGANVGASAIQTGAISVVSAVSKLSSGGNSSSNGGNEDLPASEADTGKQDLLTDEDDSSSSSHEDEWDEIKNHAWIDLPYELQCVDAVLHTVAGILTEDTYEIQETALGYIQKLVSKSGFVDDPLTVIRAVKDSVREMNARVNGFVKSLNRVLDEDEDMALMNLSRLLTHPERFIQPVPPEVLEEESDEPELVLEAHLQVALTLSNTLNLIKGQVDSAAELVDQKLDEVRNKILLANIVISTMSLCVACGSFIGSVFGMNLVNSYEDSPSAFMKVTLGTLAGMVGMYLVIMGALFYSGAITMGRHMGEVD